MGSKTFGQHTNAIVAALLTAAGMTLFYFALPFVWFIGVFLIGGYEAWTIINNRSHDTISESVWRLSKATPLIPWVFGMFTGLGISHGYFNHPLVAVSFGMLSGHFFFSRACLVTAEDRDLGAPTF